MEGMLKHYRKKMTFWIRLRTNFKNSRQCAPMGWGRSPRMPGSTWMRWKASSWHRTTLSKIREALLKMKANLAHYKKKYPLICLKMKTRGILTKWPFLQCQIVFRIMVRKLHWGSLAGGPLWSAWRTLWKRRISGSWLSTQCRWWKNLSPNLFRQKKSHLNYHSLISSLKSLQWTSIANTSMRTGLGAP